MSETVTRVFDLLDVLAARPQGQVMFTSQCNGQWRDYTIADYIDYSNRTSMALLGMGVNKGNRIATITQNRAEFNFVDMGTMQIGAIHVPIAPGISAARLAEILNEAKPKVLFISNRSVFRKITSLYADIDAIKIVSFEKVDELTHFEEFVKKPFGLVHRNLVEEARKAVSDTDQASVTYISGDHTPLKGVVLSHRAHVFNLVNFSENRFLINRQKAVSVLPLAHSFERTMNYVFQNINLPVIYSDSISALPAVLQHFHPDVMVAVPYILERYESQFEKRNDFSYGLKNKFLRQTARFLLNPNTFPEKLKLLFYSILKKIRSNKINSVVGNNLDLIICGGAELDLKTLEKFWMQGIEVYEGYGLTEAGPVVTVNDRYKIKAGSAGMPLKGVGVMISTENEILVNGNGLMSGYFASDDSPIDEKGWLHTGDRGAIDGRGFLTVTGTIKSIFKLKNGLYINPEYIEGRILSSSGSIHNIWVYGHNKNHLVALIIAAKRNAKDEECLNPINQIVEGYNSDCEKQEQVKKFRVIDDEWNTENGLLNPDLSLNRLALYEEYNEILIELYTGL